MVSKIVITGGPCGGKSTGLSRIEQELTDRGYKVYVIAEAATDLKHSGVAIGEGGLSNMEFQKAILQYQLAREKIYEEIAEKTPNEKIIILCDRAALDGLAYCTKEQFHTLIESMGLNEINLRDEYDAVFHLKSAADGAEEFYTCDNNPERDESPEEARILDGKTLNAWIGNPHVRIVDNSTDFPTKINKLMAEIYRFLGEPVPLEIERKFLVEMPDLHKLVQEHNAAKVNIIQTYLRTEDIEDEKRIRQRGNDGNYVYFETTKRLITGQKRVETENKIYKENYLTQLMLADTTLHPVRKDRFCFVYNNLYFELDVYPFWQDKAILEIELTEENQEIEIPDYIRVIKEVTDDISFKNSSIAKEIPV